MTNAENEVVLYSTGCVRCRDMEEMLTQKGLRFVKVTSVDEMIKLGLNYVPALRVNGEILEQEEAFRWIKNQ